MIVFIPTSDKRTTYGPTDALVGASGVILLCPKCFEANGGEVGTHSIICWFRGRVPDGVEPGPGRREPEGTGIDDLSFVPKRVGGTSVSLTGGCGWHGWIVDGKAEDV